MATDFFSVDTVFFKRLYVFMFVHGDTRRVLAAAVHRSAKQPG